MTFRNGFLLLSMFACLAGISPAQAPMNDTCDLAFVNSFLLNPGVNAGYTNVGATASGIVPSCPGLPLTQGPGGVPLLPIVDVWFVYSATDSCTVSFDIRGSAVTLPIAAVFDGNSYSPGGCGMLPEIECSRIGLPISVNVSAGDVLFLQVSTFLPGNSGAISVEVENTTFGLAFSSPSGPGSLTVRNSCGVANAPYATFVTTVPGAFPNGWFFGLDIGLSDMLTQVSLGAPFFGTFDGLGASTWSTTGGIPSGITLYAVTVELDANSLPVSSTPPVIYLTP